MIVNTFPDTDYAIDAKFKLDLISDILASKEMYIGRYYFKKKWIPAINRFRTVLDNYETTIYIEEALHRLVEVYYVLGLTDEAQRYANILGYNYESSEWYKKSYAVFNQMYEKERLKIQKNKSKNENIIKKNLNLFSNKWIQKIENTYLKKIKLLTRFNKNYFDKAKPIVSDFEYDQLKKEILLLEKKYKFLKNRNSPSQSVGFKPSKNFKKVMHRVPMLSLANAFSKEDLENFEKRFLIF